MFACKWGDPHHVQPCFGSSSEMVLVRCIAGNPLHLLLPLHPPLPLHTLPPLHTYHSAHSYYSRYSYHSPHSYPSTYSQPLHPLLPLCPLLPFHPLLGQLGSHQSVSAHTSHHITSHHITSHHITFLTSRSTAWSIQYWSQSCITL